ncbi:MAG: hypothetical protein Q7P63_17430 [Verrucomicrobiota bacterium JB022]|nr:hypothetical protein [Verrucomicrobiota bacterium JB022]
MKKKGKITTSPNTKKAILHLHPNSAVHEKDQADSREVRERLSHLEAIDPNFGQVQFPSVQNGFSLHADTHPMTPEEHFTFLSKEFYAREKYYSARRDDSRGKLRKHKGPIKQLAITTSPDIALTCSALDRQGIAFKDPLIGLTKILMDSFKSLTPYDLLAGQCHTREGCLHFHLIYAVVSRDKELLHPDKGVGRKGLRHAGHGLIGTFRMLDAGIISEEEAKHARRFMADRLADGRLPVDYTLAMAVDGYLLASISNFNAQDLHGCFRHEWIERKKSEILVRKLCKDPKTVIELYKDYKKKCYQIDEYEEKINKLGQEIKELKDQNLIKKHDSSVYTPNKKGYSKMPPQPPSR